MKKIGFVGVADATTLIGEVRLALAVGFETDNGKSSDPVPQSALEGATAVGAGSGLVEGDHVMGTGGVAGYCDGDGDGDGLGVGVGVIVGAGVEFVPQPVNATLTAKIARTHRGRNG